MSITGKTPFFQAKYPKVFLSEWQEICRVAKSQETRKSFALYRKVLDISPKYGIVSLEKKRNA